MIVYAANKAAFVEDIRLNRIHEKILLEFRRRLSRSVAAKEVDSWRNSLQFMANLLVDPEIPDDAGVSLEYHIPLTSKRIDFILTGQSDRREETAVIVELKQWQQAEALGKDGIICTPLGGAWRETSHPSYQAWTYAALIEDYNETVRADSIHLAPCAYLHNLDDDRAVNDPVYASHIARAPVFISRDAERLADFLKRHVRYGDRHDIMYRIENGRIRPSRSLADAVLSMLKGNDAFVMIDDQKVAFEKALELAHRAQHGEKQVLIIEGGPGTGKSVLAINLLAKLTDRDLVSQYVSRNAAPRAVYEAKLTGSFKKSRISNLFRGSGSFMESEPDCFDVLLVDEAHRLNEKSGLYGNQGENQIKEIMHAARLSVFFVDEAQRVTLKDIGTRNEIRHWAQTLGAEVTELRLASQFRCGGSDGYLAFVDHLLAIRDTANADVESIDFDVRVMESPQDLRREVLAHNANNRARMVAGYCWDWKSKKDPTAMDIEIPEHDFSAQWNLTKDGSLWALAEHSVEQIGCIHTIQGLELDYVGVIIGPDLVVRDGEIITDGRKRSSMDRSVRGIRKLYKQDPEDAQRLADEIIKNTYRTLLTRGMKGCFVFCTDPETNAWFRKQIETPANNTVMRAANYEALPYPLLATEDVRPFENAVPVFDLAVAAGEFSDAQSVEDCDWMQLPDWLRLEPNFFVTRVIGESMNKRIPNGSWCVFRANPAGTREGKIVLVAHRDIQDDDTGERYTIKRYHSEKAVGDDGSWYHTRIVLKPESRHFGYRDIELTEDAVTELRVIGELVTTL
ncbi:DNA/RNA helicase domain-containing protein [Alkalilimnicola ehrlichii]|uniref:DNA/RNA helicase domain-containing protein n=1 Tax=Alkalilimnicola ehrlichii TaxID=351052 RepID=UPI003BA070C8